MPYIKKSEYEFIQDKLRWSKDRAERHRMFEEYIHEHNYELWGFAHSDIRRKTGVTKPNKGSINLKLNKNYGKALEHDVVYKKNLFKVWELYGGKPTIIIDSKGNNVSQKTDILFEGIYISKRTHRTNNLTKLLKDNMNLLKK